MTGDCRWRTSLLYTLRTGTFKAVSARVQRFYHVPRIRHFKFYVCVHTAVLGMRMAWGRRTLPLHGRVLLVETSLTAHAAAIRGPL